MQCSFVTVRVGVVPCHGRPIRTNGWYDHHWLQRHLVCKKDLRMPSIWNIFSVNYFLYQPHVCLFSHLWTVKGLLKLFTQPDWWMTSVCELILERSKTPWPNMKLRQYTGCLVLLKLYDETRCGTISGPVCLAVWPVGIAFWNTQWIIKKWSTCTYVHKDWIQKKRRKLDECQCCIYLIST